MILFTTLKTLRSCLTMTKMSLIEIVRRAMTEGINDETIVEAVMVVKVWDQIKGYPGALGELYNEAHEAVDLIVKDRGEYIFQSMDQEKITEIVNYFSLDWVEQFWESRGYKEVPVINN